MREPIQPARRQVEIVIPGSTLLRIVGTLLLIYVSIQLASLLLLLLLALLLSVTLHPLLQELRRRRVPKAGLLLAFAVLALVAIVGTLFIPPLVEQISALANNYPEIRKNILDQVPPTGILHELAAKALKAPDAKDIEAWMKHILSFGQMAMGGLTSVLLVLIFTLYLVIDGPRTYQWLTAFFRSETREKLNLTMCEVSQVIFAYVAGQLITSLVCALYTFTVLALLKVPAALTLALLAGVFDVLPVLGFFLATIPATLLGLTVSPATALSIILLNLVYHGVENYILVPKVYGSRLRLSDLAVLLSIMVGGLMGGIAGAIVILPIVASYPIIERIWLVDYLGSRVVGKHVAQEKETDAQAASDGVDEFPS